MPSTDPDWEWHPIVGLDGSGAAGMIAPLEKPVATGALVTLCSGSWWPRCDWPVRPAYRPGPCCRPLENTRCSERCMNDKIRLTRHPLQKLVKLASALGGSQANVTRNQDVYAKAQAGEPAQDCGADQGAD